MDTFLKQSIRLSPDVMARHVGKQLFILNVNRECYFGLDEVGSRMFALLTGGASVGDTLGQLEAEYATDLDVLRRDLESLIGQLSRHELIEIVSKPEP